MKMTKRLLTMAMCGIMAASSMVSMSASATEYNIDETQLSIYRNK